MKVKKMTKKSYTTPPPVIPNFKLPISIKNKWVESLRNGTFTQGTGALFDYLEDDYCCLGVLCRIFLPEEFESHNMLGYGNLTSFLEDNIEGKKELDKNLTSFMYNLENMKNFELLEEILVNLNDIEEYSFDQIADYIEKNY